MNPLNGRSVRTPKKNERVKTDIIAVENKAALRLINSIGPRVTLSYLSFKKCLSDGRKRAQMQKI